MSTVNINFLYVIYNFNYMINNKKLIYEMKHGKIKHYQPYKTTTKITDVMKQTDNILNSYYPCHFFI